MQRSPNISRSMFRVSAEPDILTSSGVNRHPRRARATPGSCSATCTAPAGNVVGLYGRRLTDEQPRHLYLSGENRGVFNGIAARTNQTLIVTEAVFDAMSLWVAGFRNVISLYGKDGWTSDHETLMRENGVTEIVLALDGDGRGQEAAEMLEKKLCGLVKSVHRVRWPEDVKDANAFFLSRSAEDFRKLLPQASEAAPQETAGEESHLAGARKSSCGPEGGSCLGEGSQKITLTAEGFALAISGRKYELCAIEKPSAARLKATVKALSEEPGRFHIDTVDFYLSRSRKGFIAEAARLFRELPETVEADVNRITVALEKYAAQKLEGVSVVAVAVPDGDRQEALRMGRSAGLVDEMQRDFGKLGIIGEETTGCCFTWR